ncbi:hypothetical protein EVAR_47238_1 [Eumeta japonica]|uniref:CCHC-type domain-containing protein n=1 Tax=Eumeta variegata TaxID=151549 RepID=A0A4C1XRF5_EUMVA|nr:hypothetical protein EVAR_47238_1 [Eumeta japonica]
MNDPPDDTGQPPTNVLLLAFSGLVLTNEDRSFPSAGSVLHLVSFGKILQSADVQDSVNGSVKRIGRNYIALSFLNATAAKSFLCNTLFALKGLRAFIPSFNITRFGLVRGVPSDWSPEEILGFIVVSECYGQVLKIRRLNYKTMMDGSTVWKPYQTVMFTFDGHMLPQRVFLCCNTLSVEVYTYPTIQCYNCCQYGHNKAQCTSQPRCLECGNEHIGESCTVREDEVSYLQCLGRHTATSKLCPELDRQKRIKISMAEVSFLF